MTIQDQFGQKPINLRWNVTRGDTAKLRVEFLENDETTTFDISDWTFVSSSYDSKGEVVDELDVDVSENYIDIIAPADITENWGTGFSSVVAELGFDLEVIIDNEIWTPIVGTIVVSGDITGSL
jgi:hypothetical protein